MDSQKRLASQHILREKLPDDVFDVLHGNTVNQSVDALLQAYQLDSSYSRSNWSFNASYFNSFSTNRESGLKIFAGELYYFSVYLKGLDYKRRQLQPSMFLASLASDSEIW